MLHAQGRLAMNHQEDEHSPYHNPEILFPPAQETWCQFFLAICRAVALAVAIGFVLWMVKV